MLSRIWLAFAAAHTLLAATVILPSNDLIVHEWGTFTSVADAQGASIYWQPLSGPSDLPCFVRRLGGRSIKLAGARVRMETPVLYFYAPRPVTVSVRVNFPQGLITEWYPQASMVEPADVRRQAAMRARIEWSSVDVIPGAEMEYPAEKGPSHYYAARQTDSAALRVGNQQEKLIFYRGVGQFSGPLEPRLIDNQMELRNIGPDPISDVILFENRAGKVGYRRGRALRGRITLAMPELTANVENVRRELEQILISHGLYPKEARAMLETWRDTWFEPGTRVLYIVPREFVDSVLPLEITPEPVRTVRTFVGRVEILSPWMEKQIEQAFSTEDVKTLETYGRFLQPWAQRIAQRRTEFMTSSRVRSMFDAAYAQIQADFDSPRCSN